MLNGILNKVKWGGAALAITAGIQHLVPDVDTYFAPGWQDTVQWFVVMGTMYLKKETRATSDKLVKK